MKFKLLAGAALAAVFAASAASAQDTGWYGALDLGYHWADGINAKSSNPAPDGKDYDWRWSYENSHEWAGFARLGYRFDPHWRVELEGGFRNGSLGEVIQNGSSSRPLEPIGLCSGNTAAPGCGHPYGTINSYTVMANVIYDILPHNKWFDPFIGGGIGTDITYLKGEGRFSNIPDGSTPYTQYLSAKGDDAEFAAQGIAGVAVQLTHRLNLDVTYRYLWSNDASWNTANQTIGSSPAYSPGRFHGEPTDQSVSIGLRYAFSEPAAPPPPPPPPPPSPPAGADDSIARPRRERAIMPRFRALSTRCDSQRNHSDAAPSDAGLGASVKTRASVTRSKAKAGAPGRSAHRTSKTVPRSTAPE